MNFERSLIFLLSPGTKFSEKNERKGKGKGKGKERQEIGVAAMKFYSASPVFISFLLLLSFIHHSRAEVITLTADTFSDKVKEKDTAWFVKFCVPWCKHCKNLGSLWEDLGKVMEGEDEIEIGEVDCGTDKAVCSKADIHSYPTFKLFYDGEEVAKYKGTRDVESLKNFVLEEAEKAAANASNAKDEL